MRSRFFFFGAGFALCAAMLVFIFYLIDLGRSETNVQATSVQKGVLSKPFSAGLTAHTDIHDGSGAAKGEAFFEESASGVLITVIMRDMSPGNHAMHIHEHGDCTVDPNLDRADEMFMQAGDHLNPQGKAHGFLAPDGYHAGDMPAIYIASDGTGAATIFTDQITLSQDGNHTNILARIFDIDGSALVIHAGNDDYLTSPAGMAGGRIACGVIQKT